MSNFFSNITDYLISGSFLTVAIFILRYIVKSNVTVNSEIEQINEKLEALKNNIEFLSREHIDNREFMTNIKNNIMELEKVIKLELPLFKNETLQKVSEIDMMVNNVEKELLTKNFVKEELTLQILKINNKIEELEKIINNLKMRLNYKREG
jgi:chromosome segregation ATPase